MFAKGTIEQQELTLKKCKAEYLPETRARAMTEKGFEFCFATKENLQGPQTGLFIQTSLNSTDSRSAPLTAWNLKREQRT